MENPIKMDDLGVPLFLETPISLTCKDQMVATFLTRLRKSAPWKPSVFVVNHGSQSLLATHVSLSMPQITVGTAARWTTRLSYQKDVFQVLVVTRPKIFIVSWYVHIQASAIMRKKHSTRVKVAQQVAHDFFLCSCPSHPLCTQGAKWSLMPSNLKEPAKILKNPYPTPTDCTKHRVFSCRDVLWISLAHSAHPESLSNVLYALPCLHPCRKAEQPFWHGSRKLQRAPQICIDYTSIARDATRNRANKKNNKLK